LLRCRAHEFKVPHHTPRKVSDYLQCFTVPCGISGKDSSQLLEVSGRLEVRSFESKVARFSEVSLAIEPD